jgi:hypothetical protein
MNNEGQLQSWLLLFNIILTVIPNLFREPTGQASDCLACVLLGMWDTETSSAQPKDINKKLNY